MLAASNLSVKGRLAGASLGCEAGQVTAILGPNGAGKSTLLAALAGLLVPDAGEIQLDGQPLARIDSKDRARRIGYLPQSAEAAWDISVRTLVALGRLPHRGGSAADEVAVASAVAAMGLEHLADRPLSTLSGGERARAMLARVLAGEPQAILADEPLASLDLAHQSGLLSEFRQLADSGRAVVLVLHDLAAAMNHADRVVLLRQGQVAAAGAPAEVMTAGLVEQVWGVSAEWLGPVGARALSLGK